MFGPQVALITGDHRIDIPNRTMISISEHKKVPDNDQNIVFEGDNWGGAVVISDVPSMSFVGGEPAKILKFQFL